ncbi:hypothetical protein FALBO_1464 [Fusarium albosuccineum]|uniref:Uncharacterized protein n=1 Tax=Fusarium albosuccineum TaxID=1237068 RepID=A0A8H4LPL3_9HYPO|nr:hypothetical protein FALBO_1464 [Fusarium albosuccineum]
MGWEPQVFQRDACPSIPCGRLRSLGGGIENFCPPVKLPVNGRVDSCPVAQRRHGCGLSCRSGHGNGRKPRGLCGEGRPGHDPDVKEADGPGFEGREAQNAGSCAIMGTWRRMFRPPRVSRQLLGYLACQPSQKGCLSPPLVFLIELEYGGGGYSAIQKASIARVGEAAQEMNTALPIVAQLSHQQIPGQWKIWTQASYSVSQL